MPFDDFIKDFFLNNLNHQIQSLSNSYLTLFEKVLDALGLLYCSWTWTTCCELMEP